MAKGLGTTAATLERLNPGLSAIVLQTDVRLCRPQHKAKGDTTPTTSTVTVTVPAGTDDAEKPTQPRPHRSRTLLAGSAGFLAGALVAPMLLLLVRRIRRRATGQPDPDPSEDDGSSVARVGSGAPASARSSSAPEVRALALPATYASRRQTALTLTPLEPEGYVLLDDHVAVLATTVSGEHVERDQPVTLMPVGVSASHRTDHSRSTEGPDA
jgi:hypothetical protein